MPAPASAFNIFQPDAYTFMAQPKLFDRVHSVARLRHLSMGTERAYSDCVRRFILFHKKRHPAEMGAEEIRQFLSHLAVGGNVAASTQNVALCALLFLYRDVLGVELPYVEGILRAKRPARVPVVFTLPAGRTPARRLGPSKSGQPGAGRFLHFASLRMTRERVPLGSLLPPPPSTISVTGAEKISRPAPAPML